MAFSSRTVASDNRKSDQLQGFKILPARLTKTGTTVFELFRILRESFRNFSSSSLGGSHWKAYLTEDAIIPLSPKRSYHSQNGCTMAGRNSSDGSAMQAMWCFTPKVHDFDLQERFFLSVVCRIQFCCLFLDKQYGCHSITLCYSP